MAGSRVSNSNAIRAFEILLEHELVVLPRQGLGQARQDGGFLTVEFGHDRVAIVQGVEAEGRFFFGGIAHAGTDRRRQQPVAIVVEQPIVVFRNDLIATKYNHPAPLLQEIVERRYFRWVELSHIAEDDDVIRGQFAPGQLRLGNDFHVHRCGLSRNLFGRTQRLGQVIGLGLVGLGLEITVDQQDGDRLAHRHDQPTLIVECKRILVDRNLDLDGRRTW